MLKLSSKQKTVVKVYTPTESGNFQKSDLPAVFKIISREQWIDQAAELIGAGVVDAEEGEGLSVPLRMKAMSKKMTELLHDVFDGVPEGTKIDVDGEVIEDRDRIKELLITNPFTSKALFDHYAEMLQGEGRRKN